MGGTDMDSIIDVEDFRYTLGGEFDYVEREGSDCMRFDIGDVSMWLYGNSTVEGFNTLPANVRKEIKPLLKNFHILIVG
jgi:hypothetical protein